MKSRKTKKTSTCNVLCLTESWKNLDGQMAGGQDLGIYVCHNVCVAEYGNTDRTIICQRVCIINELVKCRSVYDVIFYIFQSKEFVVVQIMLSLKVWVL
jgi:hypothetical protein